MSNSQKITLVMFNMSSYSEWEGGIQNRNYHVLDNLLLDPRIEKIIAIDYLPQTFKRTLRNFWENILRKKNFPTLKKNLLTKIYQPSEKLIVYSSIAYKFNKKKFYQQLRQFLREKGVEEYVVWTYYPLDVSYFEELKPKLFVFDAVDNWIEHPSYARFRGQLADNYQTLNDRSDLIFILADEQLSLFSEREKVFKFTNAVDLKHYQREYSIVKRDIGNLPKPVIGYIGTVQDRFDLELFEYVVSKNQDKTFVIIGPIWYANLKKKLKNFKNVVLLGRKPYSEVPMYLQQVNLGIIPHKFDQFSKYTDPMKIYEYLACGIPIVTTPFVNLDEFKKVIYLAETKEEFVSQLNKALAENTPELKQNRLAAVKEHSWTKRIDKMLQLIFQRLD